MQLRKEDTIVSSQLRQNVFELSYIHSPCQYVTFFPSGKTQPDNGSQRKHN